MNDIKFEKMIERFKKISKEKNEDAQREHKKRDQKNKKSNNAKKRKIAINRRNNG